MDFSANLKRLRKAKKITQEVLAHRCGYSNQSRIGNYEASPDKDYARQPSLDEVPVIARGLGVSVGELFGEAPDQSQSVRLDPTMLAETYAALSEIYEEELGRPFKLDLESERFVLVYEARSQMSRSLSSKEERMFAIKVSAIVRQTGAELHGSRDGVSAEGPDKGSVARRVQRKKS